METFSKTEGRKKAEGVIMAIDEMGGFDNCPQSILNKMMDDCAKEIASMDHPNVDQKEVKRAFANRLQES